jgi:hypothetical protein
VHGHGVGRRRGLEADGEEDDLPVRVLLRELHGVQRRVDDAHVAAVRLHGQQVGVAARHAQHVAERREDDVGRRCDGDGAVDHLERRHAHGAAGTVDQLDLVGQQRSMPDRISVWVWPPHISMSVQRRLARRRDQR